MIRMAHRVLLRPELFLEDLNESPLSIEAATCVDAGDLYFPFRESMGFNKSTNGIVGVNISEQLGVLKTPYANVFIEVIDRLGEQVGLWCKEDDGVVYVSVFYSFNGVATRPFPRLSVQIDEHGRPFGQVALVPIVDPLVQAITGNPEKSICFEMNSFHVFGLYCLSFLNCRRQVTLTERPDFNPPDKWLRRQKKPKLKYHTLGINPLKKMVKHTESCNATGAELAWHLCRGHWKHYTAEKPLFGHYVGSVWCPPHAKGNKENGVVLKDYKIITTQETMVPNV